jgi:hypothetical protein
MKMRKEHKAPLSDAAINLLKGTSGASDYVFHGQNYKKPVSDSSLRL